MGPDREGSGTLAERRTHRGAGPGLAHAGGHRSTRTRARRYLVRASVRNLKTTTVQRL